MANLKQKCISNGHIAIIEDMYKRGKKKKKEKDVRTMWRDDRVPNWSWALLRVCTNPIWRKAFEANDLKISRKRMNIWNVKFNGSKHSKDK